MRNESDKVAGKKSKYMFYIQKPFPLKSCNL